MEFTCEVKLNLSLQTQIFVVKTEAKNYISTGKTKNDSFSLDDIAFIDWPVFEGEAMQCYSEIILNGLRETRSSKKRQESQPANFRIGAMSYFLAKKLQNGGELYVFSAVDGKEYKSNINTIDQLMKNLSEIIESNQDLETSRELQAGAMNLPSTKRISHRKRNCSKDYTVTEISLFDMQGGEFLNQLMVTSMKLTLIKSKQWFLLSDGSLIWEAPFFKGKLNEVTKIKASDKHQRLYLRNVNNAHVGGSSGNAQADEKCEIQISFDLLFVSTTCRIVTNPNIDVDVEYNHLVEDNSEDEETFEELLESSSVVNLPTITVIDSSKTFLNFKKVLNNSFTDILNIGSLKSQKSVISDVLLGTFENSVRSEYERKCEEKSEKYSRKTKPSSKGKSKGKNKDTQDNLKEPEDPELSKY